MNTFYKILYMKADFEPWWQFDGWEQYIVEAWTFEKKELFEKALAERLSTMRQSYPNERVKKERFYAFWDEKEQEYCEGCDEDAQIFHGIITEIPS